jgi:hypothetical protein
MLTQNCIAPNAIRQLFTSTGKQKAENKGSFASFAAGSSLRTPAGKRSRTSPPAPHAAAICIYIKEKEIF